MSNDRILIRGLECYAAIGVSAAEREVGQRLQFNVDVWLDLAPAGHSDKITDTVSYARLARAIVEVARCKNYSLLEHLAEEVAAHLLTSFPIEAVRVQVMKTPPPVDLRIVAAGVEIERRRGDSHG